MSEKSRYVTKASLRHITANDEASSLSGDFIIAHHSPAKVLTFKKKKFYICSDGTHTHDITTILKTLLRMITVSQCTGVNRSLRPRLLSASFESS